MMLCSRCTDVVELIDDVGVEWFAPGDVRRDRFERPHLDARVVFELVDDGVVTDDDGRLDDDGLVDGACHELVKELLLRRCELLGDGDTVLPMMSLDGDNHAGRWGR